MKKGGNHQAIQRTSFICFVTIFFLLLFSFNLSPAANTSSLPLAKGGKLPLIHLQIPKDPIERIYLGLTGSGYFKIPQIKAEAVVVKIFNLYCPICQNTASAMSDLYHWIERNPTTKNRIKLIGIGVGNSLLEVEVFKQNHGIPFPIFPDENFKIHQALGETRIPFYIAIKIDRDGSNEIVQTHLGGLTDARAFLNMIVEAYGMKQEGLLIKEDATPLSGSSSK